jgi:AcrR family transcriptional regulator
VARPAKFNNDQILDAAATLVARDGPATVSVAAIARSAGAPTGSIYHRFQSRDLLMAELWIRTVRRAQEGFIDALAHDDARHAAHGAALHVPTWCRNHLTEARVLLLYRREQLAVTWPSELGEQLDQLNQPLVEALDRFARRLNGRMTPTRREAVAMALLDVPYAAVRRHLAAGAAPPPAVDGLIVRACDALLFAP